MKLLKVANIALDEALFWEDEAKDNENEATTTEAINGAQIVFAKKSALINLKASSLFCLTPST